jgi:protein-L-isoaspartate O-methyltransferase
VYCDVLNALKLQRGHSVLNIGCGVGFFSFVASTLIGYEGKFIGVDHNKKTVHYAFTRFQNFVQRSTAFDMIEPCEPIYLVGDILKVIEIVLLN